MSFMFPRTVTIARPSIATGVGFVGYGDLTRDEPGDEVVVHIALPASIQLRSTTGATGAALPAGTRGNTAWRIFIPRRALPNPNAIKTRDTAIDDLGRRFQVTGAYWNSLGFNLLTELLEI